MTKQEIADAFLKNDLKLVWQGLGQKSTGGQTYASDIAGRVLSMYEYIRGEYGQSKALEFSMMLRKGSDDLV